MTSQQKTLVTFLLDRSGSMASRKPQTISAFNEYRDGLERDAKDLIDFTLVTFDTTSMDKICVAVPIEKAPHLSNDNFIPRDGTPLVEAAILTIEAVAASLEVRGNPKPVVCIQTDGQENASGPEYTWERLKTLIAEKTAAGWQFNFMGAGIDAYEQGAQMGISAAATMSYGDDLGETRAAYSASAANTAQFAAGARGSTLYTAEQKFAAGDKYDPNPTGAAQPLLPLAGTLSGKVKIPDRIAKRHGLDLTKAGDTAPPGVQRFRL